MPEHARAANRVFVPPLVAVILTFAPWSPAGTRADDRAACLHRAAALDLAGKVAFQDGLHDLIVDGKPNLAALATLNRDLQIALAESRAAQLDHLANTDPGRVETGDTVQAFRNFDWRDADEAALRNRSESYRDLAARIATLRRRNDGHPDWLRMRAYFAEALAISAAFRELTSHLAENDREVAALLRSCPPR